MGETYIDGVHYQEFKKFDFEEMLHTIILRYKGPKPETENQAFAISIFKWNKLAKQNGDKLAWGAGGHTCGLCMFFHCENCPVAKAGNDGCFGTPWQDYHAAEDINDFASGIEQAKAELDMLLRLYKEANKGDEFPKEWLE